MKVKNLMKFFLGSMMLMSMTACGSQGSDKIVIGGIGPYEGEYSTYGLAVRNGVELAVKEVATVLDKEVVFKGYDTKGNTTEAVNAYNKLVDEDNVTAIVGGTLSSEALAIASASQGIGTPILSPSATVEEYSTIGANIFRGCYTDPIQATQLAQFTANDLKAKTVAIIYNTGSDYSVGLTEVFTEEFEKLGGTVVASEAYASGDKDFNAQLTKIAQAAPEVIFIPNYYEDDAIIAKQIKDLGINSQLIGGDGWDGVLSVVDDPSIVEGVIFANHYSPEDEKIINFTDKYTKEYGYAPNAFAFLAYDSAKMMLQAISEAGSTEPDAIVDALSNTSYDGILGNVKFDENGDPIKSVAYVTVKDGKYATYTK